MRNLKRTLSLALTAIMLLGMMIINVSATGVYDDFTDLDEIVNKDAVNLLVNLGIVNGKEDGSYFDPTGDVTRAEMAKMIAVALNKGVDDTALYEGMNTGLTDVKGHWAEGSINFCVNRGIIAGRGDGTFDPAANVTAAEAAKMLLVAVGYDPTIEGFVGNNWSANVTAKASSLSLFDGYNGNMLATLNRDDAALLIYNALDIEMVQSYSTNNYAQTYSDHRTVLSSVYGVLKIKGVVTANKWASLEDNNLTSMSDRIDNHLIDNRTKLSNIQVYASNTVATNTSSSLIDGLQKTEISDGVYSYYRTFNVDTPVEYLGQTVTMYIRKTTILTDYEVIGVYLREIDNDVHTSAEAKTTLKDAVNKTGLTATSADTALYVNYGRCADMDAVAEQLKNGTGRGIDVTVIDNDKDGVADYILYLKRDLAVVSMSKNDVVLRQYNQGKALDKDSIVTDLSLAADDVILVVTYGERYYIEEPEVVTGVMTAYTNENTEAKTIDVDGTTYYQSGIGLLEQNYTSANNQNDIRDLNVDLCGNDPGVLFKTTYEFFLDTHGNIRAFRPTEESLPSYALILESGYNPGVYSSDASGKVTAVLADGTVDTFALNFSASATNIANQLIGNNMTSTQKDGLYNTKANIGVIELKAFLGTDYTDNSTTRPWLHSDKQYEYDDNGNVVDTVPNYDESGVAARYIFAYKSAKAELSEQPKFNYQAGNAAGYLISYTMTDDGVMTIKNIIGGVGEKAVANGTWNNFANTVNLDNANVKTLHTAGSKLTATYTSGTSTVKGNISGNIAVDRQTVAFYYEDADHYDVRVGYDKMNTVEHYYDGTTNPVDFIASTVVRVTYNSNSTTYSDSNLADAILFNDCPATIQRDWAYVLSANTVYNDYAELNVIFEDGTAGKLKLKASEYNSKFNTRNAFGTIWAYSIGSDGYATVTDQDRIQGDGYQLKVGTIELLCNGGNVYYGQGVNPRTYYSYNVNTINIWDIDSMKAGQDATKVRDITTSHTDYWKMYLVVDNDDNVRTAFVSEKLFHADHVKQSDPTHNDHKWEEWKDVNDLASNYKYATPSSGTTVYGSEVQALLDQGYDVRVASGDTLLLDGTLTIPQNRLLRVEGTLNARNYNIEGNGDLYAGAISNVREITVARVIAYNSLTLNDDTTIGANTLMYAGSVSMSNYTLTVKGDLHVGYDYDGIAGDDVNSTAAGTITGSNGVLNVDNHVETRAGLTLTNGTVNVDGSLTLIVGGALTAKTLNVNAVAQRDDSTNELKDVVKVDGTTSVQNLTVKPNSAATFDAVTIAAAPSGEKAEVKLNADITVNGTFNATNADTVSINKNVELTLNGTGNILAGASTELTGDTGATITFGASATLGAGDQSGLQWTESDSADNVGTAVGGVSFEFSSTADGSENCDGFVATEESVEKAEVEQVALTITTSPAETTDYVTVSDTDVVAISFTDKATDQEVTVTATSTTASSTVNVTVNGEESSSPVTLVKGNDTITITVVATASGKASVEKTITVKNAAIKTVAAAPDAGNGEDADA